MSNAYDTAQELLTAYENNTLLGVEGFQKTIESKAGTFTFDPALGSSIYRGDAGQIVITYIGQYANGNSGDISIQVLEDSNEVYVGGWNADAGAINPNDGNVPGDSLEVDATLAGIFAGAQSIMNANEGTGFVRYFQGAIDPTVVRKSSGLGAAEADFTPDESVVLTDQSSIHLTGTSGPDSFKSKENHYTVIKAGAGNDSISTQEVNAVAYGEDGDDSIDVSEKEGSFAYGGSGNDILTGGDEGKEGYGGHQLDVLDGGVGNDTFINVGGYVQMSGGDGKDTFRIVTTGADAAGTTIRDFAVGDAVEITGITLADAQRIAAQDAGATFAEYNIAFDGQRPTGSPDVVPDVSSGTATLIFRN